MEEYTPLLVLILVIAVFLYFLTQYQTFGLARYLFSKDATSKKKAVKLDNNVRAKFFLVVPLISTLVLKREKDDKFWVSLEYKDFVIPFYLIVNTILIGYLVFLVVISVR